MKRPKFNPELTYRCTIIRGKAQTEMDNLLPAYARIISEICPCSKDEFDDLFNDKLSQQLYHLSYDALDKNHKKTVRNHITEIAGKLFGLYYFDIEGNFFESESNAKLLEDNDQPAFFKNLCLNFQFPNGSQKIDTVLERIQDGIYFKPFYFIVALLAYAKNNKIFLTKDEIGFYVLNAKQVLKNEISVEDVYTEIMLARRNNVLNVVEKNSHHWQHIKEQLNLLTLANLIREQENYILLNEFEDRAIDYFIDNLSKPLNFDIFRYSLNHPQEKKQMFADWSFYYGKIAVSDDEVLITTLQSLREDPQLVVKKDDKIDKNALGEEGEIFVFNFEKNRVAVTHPRLVNQVKLLANQKGLGYDISSVEAGENREEPEFIRLIEVKSTKRVTAPNLTDENWIDTVNLTRREWMTAKQYRTSYNIYRVYFTPISTIICKMNDPYSKSEQGMIEVFATQYRMDFGYQGIDGEYQ